MAVVRARARSRLHHERARRTRSGAREKRNQMSVAELQELEEIKGLMDRGQQLGVLTYAEVATAVSELDLDEADVEELHSFIERAEIELVEEVDPALAAAEVERAPDKRGRGKAKTGLDLKPAMTAEFPH